MMANSRRSLIASITLGLLASLPAIPCRASPDIPFTGFANGLPLSVVVLEIVPADLSVTFGGSVDAATPVNAKENPSWRAALTDAIAPLGLTAVIKDKDVTIDMATASPKSALWAVHPDTKLREQVASWVDQANAQGCGEARQPHCYYLAKPNPDDPVEPWVITIPDSFQGNFAAALTWLRDGFWRSPRPDIEVTDNNVIIIRFVGAPQ